MRFPARPVTAAAALLSALPCTIAAQAALDSSNQRLIAALQEFIPQVMRQNGTPGLNLALARDGRIIWEAGFGFADVARRIPMTARTVMRSGSMGKTYTATAVMQLVERGVLQLDAPINTYLKGFKAVNPLGERDITVRDLLTHRSGLAGNDAGSDFTAPVPLQQHIREGYAQSTFGSYGGVPRWSARVGERFQYSNFGIATLGYLVEVTNPEGLSFSDYVQRHIIEPLGMTSTQYPPVQDAAHIKPEIFARLSTGYALMGNVRIPTPAIYFADYPAGAVVTTPGDHIKLLLAYLNGGEYQGRRILQPETITRMLTPETSRGAATQVGLVWMLTNHGTPDFSFSHAGAHMFGWHNNYRAWPGRNLAVAICTNQWDMVLWGDPSWRADYMLIEDFIASWVAREDSLRVPPRRSWAWKTSYVIGLNMAAQLKGLLGTRAPVTAGMIDRMATRAEMYATAPSGEPTWDPAGFRAGMTDMLAQQPLSAASIRTFLRSNRLQILPEELTLLTRELRGRQGFPYVGL
jgi:CubicO group peptidase (beta-lactamase class C family)